ncbi:SDR family NAD(P)-dependent oxidoreductase [Pararhodobacter sp.]|uniref:SDR family NAD(P)-dependent oxidoreductase n=1 Tax=Pararhodobacter sp. TaxID=2127056 RepID=UPI002AFF35AB|nr:SDR family NAD(P)-dependent oxidoreductase [Pararhodobacter sp.]
MFDFKGDIVWVTGSASGIGSATALLFAEHGADVVVHGLNQRDASQEIADKIIAMGRRALVVDGDLTDTDTVNAMAAEIKAQMGGLSVLVNCAGGGPRERAPIWEITDETWHATIDRNLGSVFRTQRACFAMLKASGKGRIVNVSSMTERSGGIVGAAAYTASKGGVNAFTRALAKEMAPHGIRVNAASPGLVNSPFHREDANVLYKDLVNRIPLGRIGEPVDLAGPILFLASDHAGYMTGEVIEASGGMRVR